MARTCFTLFVSFLFLASCGSGNQENRKDSATGTVTSSPDQDTAAAFDPTSPDQQIATSDSIVLDTGEMMKTLRILDSIQNAKNK